MPRRNPYEKAVDEVMAKYIDQFRRQSAGRRLVSTFWQKNHAALSKDIAKEMLKVFNKRVVADWRTLEKQPWKPLSAPVERGYDG